MRFLDFARNDRNYTLLGNFFVFTYTLKPRFFTNLVGLVKIVIGFC